MLGAPEMCPGPLARCKQAARGEQRDKSPWLCPCQGLSSTVHVPRDGIMHRWQQITGGTSGTSSPQHQMYRWGCELLSWQHRAPGSPPNSCAAAASPFPWGCRRWGKNPAKGSNPAWETHAQGGGRQGGPAPVLVCKQVDRGHPPHTSAASLGRCTSPLPLTDFPSSFSPRGICSRCPGLGRAGVPLPL